MDLSVKFNNPLNKVYLITLSIFVFNQLSGQNFLASKGAVILNGIAGFTRSGSEFYHGTKKGTQLLFSPSVDYFLIESFFVSVDAEYAYIYNSQVRVNSLGIGPGIGYVFGKPESKFFPFISTGCLFNTQAKKNLPSGYDYGDYGGYGYNPYNPYDGYNPYGYIDDTHATSTTFFIDTGVIIPIRKHIGITAGVSFHNQKYKFPGSYSLSGNTIVFKLGINWFLHKL